MSKTLNRVLIFLIVVGLLASLTVAYNRNGIESSNRTVELVLDYQDSHEFATATDYPVMEFLLKMKEAGITSVAVPELKVGDLVEEGRALVLSSSDDDGKFLRNSLSPSLKAIVDQYRKDGFKTLLVVPKTDEAMGIIGDLQARLVDNETKVYTVNDQQGAKYVVAINADLKKVMRQRIGMDRQLVADINSLGLNIVPRYGNFRKNSPDRIQAMFSQLDWAGKPKAIVFEGRDLLGYRKNLQSTAKLMKARGMNLGLIELAKQRGEEALATGLDYGAIRVHGISSGEMKILTEQTVIDRYVRAAKERGARILYIRPFPERLDSVTLVSKNRDYIMDLTKAIKSSGYKVGQAGPFKVLKTADAMLIPIALGTSAAAALLSWYVLGASVLIRSLVALGGLGIYLLMTVAGRGLLARELMALVAAITLPSLSVVSQSLVAKEKVGLVKSRNEIIRTSLVLLIRSSVLSALGGLLVVGLLGDIRFMLKLNQFIGVKLMHVAPIVLVAVTLTGLKQRFRKFKDFTSYLIRLYKSSVPVRYIVYGCILALIGLIYLARTGNNSGIPVFGAEQNFRSFLEKVLVVRPRTKEFLFGHPLLMLGFALMLGRYKQVANLALILGTIGQASLVNTYTHIHSPLLVTSLRWTYAVILGGVIGAAVTYAVDAWLKFKYKGGNGIAGKPEVHVKGAKKRGASRI